MSNGINNSQTGYLFIRALLLAVLIMFSASIHAAPVNPFAFDYSFIERELAKGPRRYVDFQQAGDTPVVYRVWGVWNLDYRAKDVAEVALDFNDYTAIFQNVYRCTRITDPALRTAPNGTWYVEGRAAIARVWAIGTIDTVVVTDSTRVRFIATQNEDPRLEAQWRYIENGWLNYRTHGVRLAAFIVADGPNSCRLGIVGQGWMTKPMPSWLIRMALNVILPQLLQDLEKEVKKRVDARKPVVIPWYRNWYHAVRDLVR